MQNYDAQVERRKLALVSDRMSSLVKSTADIDNVKIVQGQDWAYSPSQNTITYPLGGEVGIKTLAKPTIIGILLHEISHARFTGQTDLQDLGVIPAPAREYAKLINCLEDLRIEELMMDRLPGTYDSFHRVKEKAWDMFTQKDNIMKLKPHDNFLINISFDPWGYPSKFLNDKVEKFFDDYGSLFREATRLGSLEEMNDFVKDEIWEIFKTLFPPENEKKKEGEGEGKGKKSEEEKKKEEEEKKKKGKKGGKKKEDKKEGGKDKKKDKEKQKSKGDGEGEGGEGEEGEEEEGSGSGGGEGKNEGKGKPSKPEQGESGGKGQEQPQNSPELQEALDNAMDISEILDALKDNGLAKTPKEEEESFFDSLGEPKDVDNNQSSADTNLKELKKDTEQSVGGLNTRSKTYEQLYGAIEPYLLFFTKKLNSILVDNNYKRFGGAFKYGRLSSKMLYKFRCKNLRLFNRRILRQHRTYSVCLLIDESGSMSGSKIDYSAEAVVLMAEVLDKVGIPFQVCGFNTTMRTYKKYDEKFTWAVKRNLELIIPQIWRWENSGNTNDAYSINKMSYDLSKREGETILIVLTDGSPNPSHSYVLKEDKKRLPSRFVSVRDFDLKEEIIKASQSSAVIGVGLNAPYVQKNYPQAVVCEDMAQLPRMLLNILRRNIKRG